MDRAACLRSWARMDSFFRAVKWDRRGRSSLRHLVESQLGPWMEVAMAMNDDYIMMILREIFWLEMSEKDASSTAQRASEVETADGGV
jgi:hypothetical protein